MNRKEIIHFANLTIKASGIFYSVPNLVRGQRLNYDGKVLLKDIGAFRSIFDLKKKMEKYFLSIVFLI